jgi:hypothetical protein
MIPDRHPSCRGPLDLLPTSPPVSARESARECAREREREGEREKERAREREKERARERGRTHTRARERERVRARARERERERERERRGRAGKRERTLCEGMLCPLRVRVRTGMRESACVRVCTCVSLKYTKIGNSLDGKKS